MAQETERCFLGIKGLSVEVIVSDSSGVYKSRTVHRRPISDRWGIASSDLVRYAPWKVNENDEKADGEVLVAIKLTDEEIADQVREKEFDLSDAATPRRFQITKRMLVEHGYSARCEGCRAALEGQPSQNHTESCRKRILDAIGGKHAPEVEAQRKRYDAFVDKAAAKEDFDELREKKRMRSE